VVREHCPVLAETFGDIANVRIRTLGTLGGELSHGDPHSDPPPVLIGLGATIKVRSSQGEREIPASSFFTGYLETDLKSDEVLTEVRVPIPDTKVRSSYIKYCPTTSTDWPCHGMAAFVSEENGACQSLDVIFGSATEVPYHVEGLGEAASGRPLDDRLIEDVAAHCYDQVNCMGDGRGSAWYKRELVPVFARRAIQKALGREVT
jgi:carbon-monoxide dehydrogenase medium subunit